VSKAVTNDFVERCFAFARELQQDGTAIVARGRAFEQTAFFQAIGQFDNGVVLETELRGEFPDGGLGLMRETGNREQKFVLLRLQAFGARCIFAATEESRKVITKLGELYILSMGEHCGRGLAQIRIGHSSLLQRGEV